MASCYYNPKTDRFEIRAYAGIDPHTKKVDNLYVSLPGSATDEEIEQAKDDLDARAKLLRSEGVAPKVRSAFAWRMEQLEAENKSPYTLRSYQSYVDCYVNYFMGDLPLDKVKSNTINRFYREIQKEGGKDGNPISPNTVRTLHSFLRKSFASFVLAGFIDFSPMDGVTKPQEDRKEAIALNEYDFEELIKYLDEQHKAGDPLCTAYLLALDTGVRRGELAGFQVGDYRRQTQLIRVVRTLAQVGNSRGSANDKVFYKQPKTASSRRNIEIYEDTCTYLDRHIKHQRLMLASNDIKQGVKTPLFARPDGSPYRPSEYTDRFTQIVRKLGLDPAVHLHTLRHTHATYLLAGGMDLMTLKERLGHANETTTLKTYSHAVPGRGRAAAEAFVGIRKAIQEGDSDECS